MKPTNEQLEQLSAYLDGELAPPERAMVESRLSVDAGLRGELESLRRTVTVVRGMPRVTAPASIAGDVTERMARRELLGDGNARRAGEVVRFATFLRRFAVAAVLLLAAGVGWRFWYAGRGEAVIGGSATPTAGAPGAARPAGLPESAVDWGVRSAPKLEQLAKPGDRDSAAPTNGAESTARDEKLAFGNQLPPGGAAFDTRAKAMGATSATKPGFSVRADPMLDVATQNASAPPKNSADDGVEPIASTTESTNLDTFSPLGRPFDDATATLIAHGDFRVTLVSQSAPAIKELNQDLAGELLKLQLPAPGSIRDPGVRGPIISKLRYFDASRGDIATQTSDYPFRLHRGESCRLFKQIQAWAGDTPIQFERMTEPRTVTAVTNCEQLERLIFGEPNRGDAPIPAGGGEGAATTAERVVVFRTVAEFVVQPLPTTRSSTVAP